jgi:hypothetical protein
MKLEHLRDAMIVSVSSWARQCDLIATSRDPHAEARHLAATMRQSALSLYDLFDDVDGL